MRNCESISGLKQPLNLGMGKNNEKVNVNFQGQCNSNTNYFDTTYIIVE
jgi:hypothetical protein